MPGFIFTGYQSVVRGSLAAKKEGEMMQTPVFEDQPILHGKGHGAPDAGPGAVPDLRAQRIMQYANEALQKPDALDANLGAVNGDLLHMAYWLKQAIEHAMQRGPDAWMECEELLPAIDSYAKLTKQIERLAKLETRRSASRAGRA